MYDLLSRIHKGTSEDLKLVYTYEESFGYVFFVLGGSGFIYRIVINKKYQRCNCDDYYNHKNLCKHILFILFKVLRLYKLTEDNKIYLRRKQTDLYKFTDFIKNNKFCELDWNLFKNYFYNINIKANFFNKTLSEKFTNFFRKFNYMAKKSIHSVCKECPICKQKTKYAIRCDTCKSYFHSECIFEWLESIITKRCPVCRSDCWEVIYPYSHLLKNDKIPLDSVYSIK